MVIGISTYLNKLVPVSSAFKGVVCTRSLTALQKAKIRRTVNEKVEGPQILKKLRRLPAPKQALVEYVAKNVEPGELSLIPKSVVRIQKEIPYAGYLINKPVSYSIKNILGTQNLDLNGTAIEISPGLGYLTNQLLGLGFKHITCFEDSLNFSKILKLKKLPVKIIDRRFIRLAELHNVDKVDGEDRVATLLENVNRSPESRKLYVFGVAPRVNVIHFIIRSVVTHTVLHDPGYGWDSPNYYLLMSPRTYTVLTATPKLGFYSYRASSVLFQLLFNWEELGRFSRQIFIPWEAPSKINKEYTKRGKGLCPYDENSCYLVKISVNKDIINEVGKDRLVHLWYFVKNNLYARKFAVVPKLESWIPNCGPELIRKGFTIFSQFGDLTPPELLNLYKEFISLPDFHNSSFIEAVEKYISKSEVADEDVMPKRRTKNSSKVQLIS